MNTDRILFQGTVAALVLFFLAGCTSVGVGVDGPAQIAQSYIGKPLAALEWRLGPPQEENMTNGEMLATWNLNPCSVTARTDAKEFVTDVSWSKGCTAL